jgi:hypothetical protein
VLSWEEQRVVQRDWAVACAAQWYQLDRQHEALSLVCRKVIVRTLRDGRVQLAYRGKPLKWRPLPGRPAPRPRPAPKAKAAGELRPPPSHPWRQRGGSAGRPFWRGVKAEGRARRAAARRGLRDSGQPPLRSGLPTSRNPRRGKCPPPTNRTFSPEFTIGHF